jgi:hypothetical protein
MDEFAMKHWSRVVLNDWITTVRLIIPLTKFCKLHFWVCIWSITATVKATGWGTFDRIRCCYFVAKHD